MVQVRISLHGKFVRRFRRMATEYGLSFSDIMNEIAEWVLDQEKDFRKDLEAELEEFEDEEEESEDEEKGLEEEDEEEE